MLCNGQVEFTKGQIVVIRELAEGLDTIDALKDKFGGKEGGCAFVEVVPDMPCVPRLVRRRSRCLRHVPRHRHLRCPSARQRRHQPPYAALLRISAHGCESLDASCMFMCISRGDARECSAVESFLSPLPLVVASAAHD